MDMKRTFELTLVTLFAILSVGLAGAQETFTASYSSAPIFIPDADANTAVGGQISVFQSLAITDLDLRVAITHPKIRDLQLELVSPKGKTIALADRVCDTHGDFENTVFDDQATSDIGSVCAPGAVSYRPKDRLSTLNGEDTLGAWQVWARDREKNGFVGVLVDYTLTFSGIRSVSPVINADWFVSDASLVPRQLSPGALVTVVGEGIGPAQPMVAEIDGGTGALPTVLGGARVNIGGIDAPLVRAAFRVLTFQVPWETPTGGYVAIQTFAGEVASNTVHLLVEETSPGVYTASSSGAGSVKAINQDGTLNDAEHPARTGDVIVIYATGLGQVEPPVPTGQPAPVGPVFSANIPVTAQIETNAAEVLFAGLAPGLVGVYQLNIRVPAIPEAPTSPSVARLRLQSNQQSSQTYIWIWVE